MNIRNIIDSSKNSILNALLVDKCRLIKLGKYCLKRARNGVSINKSSTTSLAVVSFYDLLNIIVMI